MKTGEKTAVIMWAFRY